MGEGGRGREIALCGYASLGFAGDCLMTQNGRIGKQVLLCVVGVPNLIADMNAQMLKFTVNDGDLKAGGNRCDDVVYTQSLAYFNALQAPAMFTPGDND